jgi:hypothetical protein
VLKKVAMPQVPLRVLQISFVVTIPPLLLEYLSRDVGVRNTSAVAMPRESILPIPELKGRSQRSCYIYILNFLALEFSFKF